MRVARDRDRLAHARELGGLLAEPHLVQEVPRVADGGGPGAGARLHLLRAADEGHEPLDERVVAPDRVPDLRRLLEQARQHLLELLELEGGVRPVALDRALDARARAHPLLALRIARADEEDEALGRVGREHAHRLRLREAGHVREVAVLPVGVEDVGRARPLGRGGE